MTALRLNFMELVTTVLQHLTKRLEDLLLEAVRQGLPLDSAVKCLYVPEEHKDPDILWRLCSSQGQDVRGREVLLPESSE